MGETAALGIPARTRAATLAGRLVAEASRRLGAGEGSVIGGRVTLAVDPAALELLAAGYRSALVSGTNGKTTTTRLLTAGLSTLGPVTSNAAGANLLAGLVGALSHPGGSGAARALAALEVDEGLLAQAVAAVNPAVVVLLNLSRDQLDRIGEVRLHADAWRRALTAAPSVAVMANADDPLVAWAALAAAQAGSVVVWVGTGQRWHADAASCPACGGRIRWEAADRAGSHWECPSCGLARPDAQLWLDENDLVSAHGLRLPVRLGVPGRFNQANAVMAAAAARHLGADLEPALEAMGRITTVSGRYEVVPVGSVDVRLLLAKNPAGWAETLDLIRPAPVPVVIGINARTADGHDPSWLWDVPFERLRGRPVVATGERGRDLAVRLRYADVDHAYVAGYREAVARAASSGAGTAIDLAANYTSFQDARKALNA